MSSVPIVKNFKPSNIDFERGYDDSLRVFMDTERLHLESIQEKDKKNCVALFGNKNIMAKYAEREPRSKEKVVDRIDNSWIKRWKENDPFSAMSVFLKDEDDYIGSIVIGHGNEPGKSEMAFLFKENVWRQGYGTESAGAMIYGFAPETVNRGYKLEGEVLNEIYATTSFDHPGSRRLLEKVGMERKDFSVEKKYNSENKETSSIEKEIYSITSDKFMKV